MELFEREGELAAIHRLLGEGGLLAVEGPAGIGKTSLLTAAARGGGGREALGARGALLETSYPFGVARQLFEPPLRGPDRARLLRAGGGAAPAVDPDAPADADDATGFTVLRGLTALAVDLATHRPLLLVIDDAQWADLPSLRFAAFLARRLDGPDIAMLIGIRTGEPGAPEGLLDELRAGRVLHPSPLSETATSAVIRARDPHADAVACRACHAATDGNPLLLTEVTRGMGSGEDPLAAAAVGLAAGVRRRIERSDPAGLVVAKAAAVLGGGATLARIAGLAGIDPVAAGRAVTTLCSAGVLRAPEPYAFTHPLVQAAVLEAIDEGERIVLRRAAVGVLEAEGASAEQIAAQLLATPGTGDPGVVDRLRDAARAALARGAAQSAVPLLRRALAEPPIGSARGDVLRELGTTERLVGEETAIGHLREAQDLGGPHERAVLAREVAMAQYDLSYYQAAADTLTAALREAPEDLDADLRDALRVDLLTVALQVSSVDVETLLAGEMTASVSAALQIASVAMELVERPVAETGPELEAMLRAAPPAPDRLDVHTPLWFALILCERLEAVREMLDAVEASGTGWMRRQFAINLARARLEHRLGELDGARATHEANLEIGLDNRTGVLFTRAGLASVCVDLGDIDRAESLLSADDVPPSRTESHLAWVHWAIGRTLAARGEDEAAMHAFEAGCEIQRAFPTDRLAVWEEGGTDRIACCIRLGREAEARADVARAAALARGAGLRGLAGVAERLQGLLDDDRGRLQVSVQLLRGTPLRLELARSLCELGSATRRSGKRVDAREPLRQALDLAHACGARPLAVRAREELVLAGARPRREAHTGRDALTAAQQRVARLVAAGRSNRQVAQELYVTVKTVEGHLADTFRKLDVHRREDLAAALAGAGDTERPASA